MMDMTIVITAFVLGKGRQKRIPCKCIWLAMALVSQGIFMAQCFRLSLEVLLILYDRSCVSGLISDVPEIFAASSDG